LFWFFTNHLLVHSGHCAAALSVPAGAEAIAFDPPGGANLAAEDARSPEMRLMNF
jgi:hypothetical protein